MQTTNIQTPSMPHTDTQRRNNGSNESYLVTSWFSRTLCSIPLFSNTPWMVVSIGLSPLLICLGTSPFKLLPFHAKVRPSAVMMGAAIYYGYSTSSIPLTLSAIAAEAFSLGAGELAGYFYRRRHQPLNESQV